MESYRLRVGATCFVIFASCASSSVWAGEYPINARAASLQPKQSELVLSSLVEAARKGQKELVIQDPKDEIDPRQWILVRSLDGQRQEIHCIKSVQRNPEGGNFEVRLKLSDGLKHYYSLGSQLIQGTVNRERGVVARLAKGRDHADQKLTLDSAADVDLLEQLIIQSPDGATREAHCVRWIEGRDVVLFSKLFNDYDEGSLLIQGGAIDGEIERDDLPCHCENKKDWGR